MNSEDIPKVEFSELILNLGIFARNLINNGWTK